MKVPKLAGLAEIAGLAGVSRQRAGQLANHPDFPAPVQRLAMGPVWLEADVTKFLAVPRKPGRRRSAQAPEPPLPSLPSRHASPGTACKHEHALKGWCRECRTGGH